MMTFMIYKVIQLDISLDHTWHTYRPNIKIYLINDYRVSVAYLFYEYHKGSLTSLITEHTLWLPCYNPLSLTKHFI